MRDLLDLFTVTSAVTPHDTDDYEAMTYGDVPSMPAGAVAQAAAQG